MTGIVTGIAVGGATIVYTLSNGCAATVTIIVSPGITPITGGNTVCVGTATLLSNITPGGTWTSSAPGVASVSGGGLVTGLSLGVTTISYVVGSFCPVSMVVSVNANPGPISGAPTVCEGSTIPLANTVTGGVWSSSNTAIATIHATSGALTGVAAGIADITYTMGASCFVTKNIVVDPLPAPITGPNTACATHTLVLSDITPGGLWSSASTGIATVGVGIRNSDRHERRSGAYQLYHRHRMRSGVPHNDKPDACPYQRFIGGVPLRYYHIDQRSGRRYMDQFIGCSNCGFFERGGHGEYL
jgi:hypothetical protein